MPTPAPQKSSPRTTKEPPKNVSLTLLYALLVAAFLVLQSVAWPADGNLIRRHFMIAQATNHAANAPAPPRPSRTRLTNPLGSGVTFQILAGRAVGLFMSISGSLALLMFVYGGFVWATSAGNPENIKKGKQIFTWAVIGLLFIFIAYAILNALFGALGLA